LLLFSNCWVALSVGTLVIGFARYYCITDCYLYGTFAFLGTFVTYNFHRLIRNKTFRKEAIATGRSTWLDRYRLMIVVLSAISAIAAAAIFFFLPIVPLSLLLLAGCAVIVGFYALPVPLFGKPLRQIGGLKSLWIVAVWTVMIAVPPLNREKDLQWLDLAHVALFAWIQILPFDIRDARYDPPGMRTLPQVLGIRGTRWLGTFLLLALGCSLVVHHGIHWLMFLAVGIALAGLWWKQRTENLGLLELSWDGALLVMGLFYYALGCTIS
jgi:hypothetical protein